MVDQGWNVMQVGITDLGSKSPLDTIKFPVISSDPQRDYWALGPLRESLQTFLPDVTFTLFDHWMVVAEGVPSPGGLLGLPGRQLTTVVHYFPIDGEPMPSYWRPILYEVDFPVAMADYGVKVVQQQCPNLPVRRIYHGVETDTFRPYDDATRQALRARWGLDGKFVVGMVNRFQPRKNIPSGLKAFALFHQKFPNSHLILRMSTRDVGGDLYALLERYNIALATTIIDSTPAQGVPQEQLVDIYNLCDLTIHPSQGEGFGLTALESRACGTPAFVTDFSASAELVADKIERIPVRARYVSARNIEQALIDEKELARRMVQYARQSPQGLQAWRQKVRARAEEFAWDKILPQFRDLFEEAYRAQQLRRQKIVLPRLLPVHEVRTATQIPKWH